MSIHSSLHMLTKLYVAISIHCNVQGRGTRHVDSGTYKKNTHTKIARRLPVAIKTGTAVNSEGARTTIAQRRRHQRLEHIVSLFATPPRNLSASRGANFLHADQEPTYWVILNYQKLPDIRCPLYIGNNPTKVVFLSSLVPTSRIGEGTQNTFTHKKK